MNEKDAIESSSESDDVDGVEYGEFDNIEDDEGELSDVGSDKSGAITDSEEEQTSRRVKRKKGRENYDLFRGMGAIPYTLTHDGEIVLQKGHVFNNVTAYREVL